MLAIREEGRGEALVLVHGAGTSGAIWRRSMPLLAAQRRVIAPDLPGYGGSPAAGPGFALEQVSDHLEAGLARVRARPARARHRDGRGELALAALRRLATLGATPADRRLLADGEMGATAVDSFLEAAAGGVDGMIDDYVACCTPWGFDLPEVLGEVHVWHGERDRFVPVAHARALAAALPRCRARFDAQDGHFFFRRRVAELLGALVAASQPPKARAAAATSSS